MDIKEFLTELCQKTRVSGFEHEGGALELVRERFSPFCDDISVDRAGNVLALKRGRTGGFTVMFAAHLDEIGYLVTRIDERGLLRLARLGGGEQARVLIGQECAVHAESGEMFGVIGVIPPHMKNSGAGGNDKAPVLDDLGVDVGYSDDVEALKKLVKIGDRVTVKRVPFELKNDRLAARAIDDAAGVAALLYAAEALRDFNHDVDIVFALTAREEPFANGGALCAAQGVMPDAAIAVDVTDGKYAGKDEFASFEPGTGAVIGVGPFCNRELFERLKETAVDENIPYAVEVNANFTHTDADNLQEVGAAAGVIGIPLKYMHSPAEVVKISDIEAAGRLCAAFVRSLNDNPLWEE